MFPKRFARNHPSKAEDKNIVLCGSARFTVLSPKLIRIEYDVDAQFEDRATQTVINRRLGDVEFSKETVGDEIVIRTDSLELHYNSKLGFVPDGLYIKVLCMNDCPTWHFGDTLHTLKGTCRTLDGAGYPHSLESFDLGDGVCSREGFSILDDSKSLPILEDGWVEPRKRNIFDLYFFGFGHDYIGATRAFYSISGFPPLLPNYVFGNWWSRFHNYSQKEYMDLMSTFAMEDIPFTVAVIDMDWHWSRGAGGKPWYETWTGYSWNTELFPKPHEFIGWLRDHNLHPTLNLHPAKGIQDHEDCYTDMANAMGIDPKSKKTVEFQPTSKDFWDPYFKFAHHPHEDMGVDFWWMDWQQGTTTDMPGLDPLWILNHLHSLDCQRDEDKRPMFFSRYAGPGSQRFFVGFSGDTEVSWKVLKFETSFTPTASNIGYPYWSHDVGGFQCGERDDELYARWVQFGVFSPICRLHSIDDDFMSKEPWRFDANAEKAACSALRMRHAMFPYLYTMNHRTHTEGLPLCMPLYYSYPEEENAYKYNNQYFFGSEAIFCPITEKCNPTTKLAKTQIWLPEGKWIDFRNGLIYEGSKEYTTYRNLNDFMLFCKAGAILPLNIYTDKNNSQTDVAGRDVYIFPGADNTFTLYEDEGVNNRYKDGHFATTKMHLEWSDNKAVFTIEPAQGDILILPESRNYFLRFVGFSANAKVTVEADNGDGAPSPYHIQNTQNALELAINDVFTYVGAKITIEDENGVLGSMEHAKKIYFNRIMAAQIPNDYKNRIYKILTESHYTLPQRYMELSKYNKVHPELIDALKEILDVVKE